MTDQRDIKLGRHKIVFRDFTIVGANKVSDKMAARILVRHRKFVVNNAPNSVHFERHFVRGGRACHHF